MIERALIAFSDRQMGSPDVIAFPSGSVPSVLDFVVGRHMAFVYGVKLACAQVFFFVLLCLCSVGLEKIVLKKCNYRLTRAAQCPIYYIDDRNGKATKRKGKRT